MVSTRPDLSFVTIKLARYTKNPDKVHFQVLKRVFRYLARSKNLVISFYPASNSNVGVKPVDSIASANIAMQIGPAPIVKKASRYLASYLK
ncbi:hypothetical protein N7530_003769 [Penicillium desertorum]|uniref:Reverse transcriptase Ty1/copia-type domain-containing protein n=1 Tax=Penicillium desertorum TaxID=1303715 RepID=A0A9W9WX00_9EURO|nr:hypothetical protein N7530_003769 [Penicillium desertorum]